MKSLQFTFISLLVCNVYKLTTQRCGPSAEPCLKACCCKARIGHIECFAGLTERFELQELPHKERYRLVSFNYGCEYRPNVDWNRYFTNVKYLFWHAHSNCPCLIRTQILQDMEIRHRCIINQVNSLLFLPSFVSLSKTNT